MPTTARKTSRYRDKHEAANGVRVFTIRPKTENQSRLLSVIEDYEIVIALGPAGTGKTYCSAAKVAQLYQGGLYDKIILARSIIPTGKSMGYLPGDVKEKLRPWLLPMLSVLEKAFGKNKYEAMYAKGDIDLQPLETIRGRSYENSLIMVDECQNLDFEEIKAITTRLGEGSKMILMGDTFQSDIKGSSSILKFSNMCNRHDLEIPVVQFDADDIVRSDIVGKLVRMFMKEAK